MQLERVILFLDYANIHHAARERGMQLNYQHLLYYVGENRFLVDPHCYVPIDPRNPHRLDRDIEELWNAGYIVTTKTGSVAGGTYKCNFDVEIAMDMLKAVNQIKPDIIVLASGDSDFVPLIQEVRKSGVRVEVAAFEESIGPDMLLKSSGFIDITVYYEDYLVALQLQREQGDEMDAQYQRLLRQQSGEQDTEDIQQKLQAQQNAPDEDDEVEDDDEDEVEDEDADNDEKGEGEKVNVPVEKMKDEAPVAPSDIADMTRTTDISAIIDGLDV